MTKQGHNFVMTTNIIASAWDIKENMEFIEKEADMIWLNKDSGEFAKGAECPFISGTLFAGMGDLVPDVKIAAKKAAKPKTKASVCTIVI